MMGWPLLLVLRLGGEKARKKKENGHSGIIVRYIL